MPNRIRIPSRFPAGTAFWSAAAGDEIVEIPGRGVFKLADTGRELIGVPSMPEGGLHPIAESTFRLCAGACRNFAGTGRTLERGPDRHDALVTMERAAEDLQRYLAVHPGAVNQVEPQLLAVAEQLLGEASLEQVPARRALSEIGFVDQAPGGPYMRWQVESRGRVLRFGAGPGPCEGWSLDAALEGPLRPIGAVSVFPAVEQRGAVALAVLNLWRQAFGRTARPPGTLDVARLFEQYGPDSWRREFGLPCMILNGDELRDARRRIRKIQGLSTWNLVDLAMESDCLRLNVCGATYRVRAQGGLGIPVRIWLDDLLAIPPSLVRGEKITVERGAAGLNINWYVMPFR